VPRHAALPWLQGLGGLENFAGRGFPKVGGGKKVKQMIIDI